MTRRLCFILGDQLSLGLSALEGFDPARDMVLMAEVAAEARSAPHHKQKIAFLFSAMRHFAQDLREKGWRTRYICLDDPQNTQCFAGELLRAVAEETPEEVVLTEASEWRVEQIFADLDRALKITLRPDTRFFCSRAEFLTLKTAKKNGRMEYFYREMRRRTGILMQEGAPLGGQWNFDHDNRKPLPKSQRPPARARFAPDAITQEVIALVAREFAQNFGDLEGFGWAVTRDDALKALTHFIDDCLPLFGDYQDAMKTGEDFLYHSLISPYLNAGLLTAAEICAMAEAAYHAGRAPLNAVEGFVRQILGWREFVRGIYWSEMPDYAATNHLEAHRPLPALYWTGATELKCMAECIRTTRQHAYAHHIQRLMVTGNFALLIGVEPAQIEEWYLAVYADAFDWVELPNVHGMVMHADGGRLGSKPYAASGAYINRMSDYCAGCVYDPKEKLGAKACPFNYLYWNFMIETQELLGKNPRMGIIYRGLAQMSQAQRDEIRAQSLAFIDGLAGWEPPVQAQMSLF